MGGRSGARLRAPRASPRSGSRGSGRFIVITGLSGSGKSQAIRTLEDLGYFCVDNLPTMLIPTLAQLSLRQGTEFQKVAIVVDVREGAFLSQFPTVWRRLTRMPRLEPSLIFLEATHAALVRRFSETRRPHPLGTGESVIDNIRAERLALAPIRKMADLTIDTSKFNVHELRRFIRGRFSGADERATMLVALTSFGYRHGVPPDSDLVFDVRFLPNPNFVPRLKPQTGNDPAVVRFMKRQPDTAAFLRRLESLLAYVIPRYVREGKSYLTIAVGCTGGRHRSVMMANALGEAIERKGYTVRVRHRDLRQG